ncbi:hypothetical protein [uncultured Algimonas sp.]|uniref:hypothetical protein n=1 Tax=uncultured Algimonas sp. TaxID=1547920 RepID=UPI00261A9985|nr:hypothetical protein [uncultured Algimonas sp.]
MSQDKNNESDEKDKSDSESDQSGQDGSSNGSATREDPPPTFVIWVVRLLSVSAMLMIVAYLVYMIMSDTVPAQFDIRPEFSELDERDGNFVLPLTVVNTSTVAVTTVVVVAELDGPGDRDDTISATLPLMGEGETARLDLVFEQKPSEGNLKLRVTSYQSP